MGKPQEDREDVRIIAEALIRFGQMSFEDFKAHAETHPEDKWHELDLGEHHRMIGREAALAFARLAKRQRQIDPFRESIDEVELEKAVRTAFVETFIRDQRAWAEQKWIDRMLNSATKRVKGKQEAITHFFPCVFLYRGHPDEFRVGPVRLISTSKFLADYRSKIMADHASADERRKRTLATLVAEGKHPEPRLSDEEQERAGNFMLEWVFEYYGDFTWIAEVAVPVCSAKVSQDRAETAVQAALDVLKLVFGSSCGKHFRLAHQAGMREKTARLTRAVDGEFSYSIARGGEGGLAGDEWYEELQAHDSSLLDAAGSAINAYIQPGEPASEHRDRWLGALNWYGQAISERIPAAQLVKYVAALERLTVLEETGTTEEHGPNVTDVVTRRTALLAAGTVETEAIAKARREARKIYRWRCDLMHGRSSPVTNELLGVMNTAHRLTRDAMFSALDIFLHLATAGKGKGQDLEDLYTKLETNLPTEATGPSLESIG